MTISLPILPENNPNCPIHVPVDHVKRSGWRWSHWSAAAITNHLDHGYKMAGDGGMTGPVTTFENARVVKRSR
ncbi:MAG: hypothetical protein ACREDL_17910 [Bradyrhizobium sp.]